MQHLEKTPNEYIRWRYAIGEDRENLSKVTRKVSSSHPSHLPAAVADAYLRTVLLVGRPCVCHVLLPVLLQLTLRRCGPGMDAEHVAVVQQISDEELAKMQQQFKMEDGTKRVLDKLVARRKLKKQYEYEVQWKGFDPTQNTWMPRDK